MRFAFLITVLLIAACGGADELIPIDAPTVVDVAQIDADLSIRRCDQIDATGLTSGTIDALVTQYDGRPCVAPLEGGIPSQLHECGYGGSLTVCGQSSGLRQFGCACNSGALDCSNGEAIKAAAEMTCGGDAGVDAP